MELSLSGCSISHVPKDGKKKKHELRIVHQGTDALVLAVQSQEQAEQWLKVTAPPPPPTMLGCCLSLVGVGITGYPMVRDTDNILQ